MKIALYRRLVASIAFAGVASLHSMAAGIIVGSPTGTPADSPAAHVDPNVASSPYAGVVGVQVTGSVATSGVLLRTSDPNYSYVLTAAHVVDTNRNGGVATGANVTVDVNYSGNASSVFNASAVYVNPSWYSYPTGPGVPANSNDDLAIIRLNGKVPAGVPTYKLYRTPTTFSDASRLITLVGYGDSGNGVTGVTVGASPIVKRTGQNMVDAIDVDDEGSGSVELFAFDFDHPDGTNGPYGGPSLGNNVEVNFGIGDSGGPAFVNVGGELQIYGINTFGYNGDTSAENFPLFGSGGGGQVVSAYTSFIDQYAVPEPTGLIGLAMVGGLLSWRNRRSAASNPRR